MRERRPRAVRQPAGGMCSLPLSLFHSFFFLFFSLHVAFSAVVMRTVCESLGLTCVRAQDLLQIHAYATPALMAQVSAALFEFSAGAPDIALPLLTAACRAYVCLSFRSA